MRGTLLAAMASVGALWGCGSDSDAQVAQEVSQRPALAVTEPCAADGTFTVWCGFKNPEDLAPTPDRKRTIRRTGLGYGQRRTLAHLLCHLCI